jgi:transglutaminase-like putative cysteine protease
MERLKLNWVFGVMVTLVFISLLVVRVGVFQRDEVGISGPASISSSPSDRETWMNIFQKDQKIGYVHRQLFKTDEGYRIMESVFMRINTMGLVQDIRFKTIGDLNHRLALSTFDFELHSSLFRFKARGGVQGKTLTFYSGPTGTEQKFDLPIAKEISLPAGVLLSLANEDLKEGDSRAFHVFDPISMAQRPMKVTVVMEETISVMGREERAKKASVDFMGVSQLAWIGKDGTVLREEGALGIRLERTTQEEALKKDTFFASSDLTEVASVTANQSIPNAYELKELRIKLEGIGTDRLFLEEDRQSFKEKVLTVRKESVLNLTSGKRKEFEVDRKKYLETTPFIQSDHPEIQAKAKEIVSKGDSDVVKATKLVNWVHQNIQKRPVLSVPNALETLRNKVGDCNEHAVLLTALARASGIPAEIEAGLVYQNGRFYYHAWNVLHLGGWITADAVMGQFPADVTHLRFVRGTESQIDLMGIMGKVRIEILSMF